MLKTSANTARDLCVVGGKCKNPPGRYVTQHTLHLSQHTLHSQHILRRQHYSPQVQHARLRTDVELVALLVVEDGPSSETRPSRGRQPEHICHQAEAGGRPELDLALAGRIKAGGRIGRSLRSSGAQAARLSVCLPAWAAVPLRFHMDADVTSCSCGSASPAASLATHLVGVGVRGRGRGEIS